VHHKKSSRRRGAQGLQGHKNGKHQRKDKQFCAQVLEAVQLALAEVYDEDLLSLFVLEARPAPHLGRIELLVEAPRGADLTRILEKLQQMTAYFRAEVASSIHRKKVPDLSFVITPTREAE
jgi:ribosome-binding factor A